MVKHPSLNQESFSFMFALSVLSCLGKPPFLACLSCQSSSVQENPLLLHVCLVSPLVFRKTISHSCSPCKSSRAQANPFSLACFPCQSPRAQANHFYFLVSLSVLSCLGEPFLSFMFALLVLSCLGKSFLIQVRLVSHLVLRRTLYLLHVFLVRPLVLRKILSHSCLSCQFYSDQENHFSFMFSFPVLSCLDEHPVVGIDLRIQEKFYNCTLATLWFMYIYLVDPNNPIIGLNHTFTIQTTLFFILWPYPLLVNAKPFFSLTNYHITLFYTTSNFLSLMQFNQLFLFLLSLKPFCKTILLLRK